MNLGIFPRPKPCKEGKYTGFFQVLGPLNKEKTIYDGLHIASLFQVQRLLPRVNLGIFLTQSLYGGEVEFFPSPRVYIEGENSEFFQVPGSLHKERAIIIQVTATDRDRD